MEARRGQNDAIARARAIFVVVLFMMEETLKARILLNLRGIRIIWIRFVRFDRSLQKPKRRYFTCTVDFFVART